jgi:uncharacterized membrane protein
MKIRIPLIVSLLILAAMAGLSAWAWLRIPDKAHIAVHFTASGQANGFSDKLPALTIMPAMALALIALCSLIPHIEPRRLNLAASAKFYSAAWIGGVAALGIAHTEIVLDALHLTAHPASVTAYTLPAIMIVLGNYIGKSRANFFAGVRTAWTLSSDYAWEKTNRLAGRLFILAGCIGLIATAALDRATAMLATVFCVLAAAAISTVASYFFWRRDPARHSGDGVPE